MAQATGPGRDRTRDPPPRGGTRRHPRRGQHPRPADPLGERLAPKPAGVLVAVDPRPAGGARDGRHPRTRAPARVRPRPTLLVGRRHAASGSQGVAALAPRPFGGVARGPRRVVVRRRTSTRRPAGRYTTRATRQVADHSILLTATALGRSGGRSG